MSEEDFSHWEERYPLGHKVRVLAVHRAGLIALEKPLNILSHPNSRRDKKRSLIQAHYSMKRECYYDLHEEGDELHLCHRLDSATSGVILLATNREMADVVRRLFRERRVDKQYYAIVRGRPPANPDTWIDTFSPAIRSNQPVGKGPKPILMRSKQQLIKGDANRIGLSLLRLIPYTGRTHQLRMQCAAHYHPIVGDKTYGDFMLNRAIARGIGIDRLYLHAASIALEFMHEGELQRFRAESAMPHSFEMVIDQNAALSKIPFNLNRPPRPHAMGPPAPPHGRKRHHHHGRRLPRLNLPPPPPPNPDEL